MKNRYLKMQVKVKGLDELRGKLKEIQKLLEEINKLTLVLTTDFGGKKDIDDLTEHLAERLKGGKEAPSQLANIPTKELITELEARGGKYIESRPYTMREIIVKSKYSTDRTIEYPKKILVLDKLSGI